MNKKISIPVAVTIAAVFGAICFSVAYLIATNTISNTVTDLNQRKAMFTKLSEVDLAVRQNYTGTIDEAKLTEALCNGYVSGVNGDEIFYLSAEDFAKSSYSKDTSVKIIKLSDGSAVIINQKGTSATATPDQAQTDTSSTTE